MSTMALKLPSNFVDVERDEMQYVDGGYTESYAWWGYSMRFSEDETQHLIELVGAGAGASALASEFGLPLIVATVIGAVGALIVGADAAGGWKGVTFIKPFYQQYAVVVPN